MRTLILAILLSLTFTTHSHSQSLQFGIEWDLPSNKTLAKKDLEFFQRNGIEHLLIRGFIPVNIIDLINTFDFKVHILSNNTFLTDSYLKSEDYITSLYDIHSYYKILDDNWNLIIHEYSESIRDENAFLEKIDFLEKEQLYVVSNRINTTSNFPTFLTIHDINDTERISSENVDAFILRLNSENNFNRILHQVVKRINSQIIFISSNLYLENSNSNNIQYEISELIKDSNYLIPLNPIKNQQKSRTLPVGIFLAGIGFFGLLFSFDPSYRKSIVRYFNAHSFFVADIINYRVRLFSSVILTFLIQSLFMGLLFIILFDLKLSSIGKEVLFSNLGFLSFGLESPIGYFFFGITFNIIINLLFTNLVKFSLPSLKSIFQVLILTFWPQIINFFIIILILNGYLNNINEQTQYLFILSYFLTILISYIICYWGLLSHKNGILMKLMLKSILPIIIILGFAVYYALDVLVLVEVLSLAFKLS